MQIVLISPSLTEIRSFEGENLRSAIEGFWTSVWEEGWNPDERILSDYGDWVVYQQTEDGNLINQGTLKSLPEMQHLLGKGALKIAPELRRFLE